MSHHHAPPGHWQHPPIDSKASTTTVHQRADPPAALILAALANSLPFVVPGDPSPPPTLHLRRPRIPASHPAYSFLSLPRVHTRVHTNFSLHPVVAPREPNTLCAPWVKVPWPMVRPSQPPHLASHWYELVLKAPALSVSLRGKYSLRGSPHPSGAVYSFIYLLRVLP